LSGVLWVSITGSVVHLATNVVDTLGLGGIFVLQSACIPIPAMRGVSASAKTSVRCSAIRNGFSPGPRPVMRAMLSGGVRRERRRWSWWRFASA
jgi:hypothetical protein